MARLFVKRKFLAPVFVFGLLCLFAVSAVYWARQFTHPAVDQSPSRPRSSPAVDVMQAASLFGGENGPASTPADGDYLLLGVMAAKRASDSIAIVSVDDKPGRPFRLGAEIAPGVILEDVQPTYVVLIAHGVAQHLALPAHAVHQKDADMPTATANVGPPPGVPPAPPEDRDDHPPNRE